ncbi:hypothetical protein HDU88_002318 [Geranomyces variabilis]|nr:hypothetical protein HDU88_002318 [Geranomyces variabilis]
MESVLYICDSWPTQAPTYSKTEALSVDASTSRSKTTTYSLYEMLQLEEEADPIIIAHRGNIDGPIKETENSLASIDRAIAMGFHVEIDIWLIKDQLFLGHDGPETLILLPDLELRASKLWCHAKNVHALAYLLKRGQMFRSFSHDVDDHVITSDQRIWTYPGKELVSGSIAVMPERAKELPGIWTTYAICTDFPALYAVYLEMHARNRRTLLSADAPVNSDPAIAPNAVDPRRCVAVYTMFDKFSPARAFQNMRCDLLKRLPNNNCYAQDGPLAYVHWTFLQVLGFEQQSDHLVFNEKVGEYLAILQEEISTLLPLEITYRGLEPVPSGLVMMGYPSKDVNTWRRRLDARFSAAGLPFRKYQNDIVHSTILRLHSQVSPADLVKKGDQWRDTFFGTLTVQELKVGFASWRMRPGECDVRATLTQNFTEENRVPSSVQ